MVVGSPCGLASPARDWTWVSDRVGTCQVSNLRMKFTVEKNGARLWYFGSDIRNGLDLGWHPANLYRFPPCTTVREQLTFLRQAMSDQAEHEVSEGFLFQGVRVFDPHA